MSKTTVIKQIESHIMTNELFRKTPGSLGFHHAREGGLIEHTLQVIRLAEDMAKNFRDVDRDVVFMAALCHDIGKTREYVEEDGKWKRNEDCCHITHSAFLFNDLMDMFGKFDGDEAFRQRVLHCILSHHGRVEWGAKEIPSTTEAMIVHYADMLSVAMDRGNGKFGLR